MKVSELISRLQQLDQNATIKVVVPIEGRHYGGGFLKELVQRIVIASMVDSQTSDYAYNGK